MCVIESVCVCDRGLERERESVYVSVCLCDRVLEREREGESSYEGVVEDNGI